MQLTTRTFRCSRNDWSGDFWWEDYNINAGDQFDCLRLCYDTMYDFIEIPDSINQIEITLSTNRLSKHSLEIKSYDVLCSILVDGEKIEMAQTVCWFLDEFFNTYDKLYVTVYYEE